MNLNLLGLFIFIIYIPIFLSSLLYLKWQNSKMAIEALWISSLGETTSVHGWLFNLLISLFGLLSLVFVFNFQNLLPQTSLTVFSLLFLYLTGVAAFLVGFFPNNTAEKIHYKIAVLLFTSIILSSFLTIHSIYYSSLIPQWTILLNLILLGSFIFPGISWLYGLSKRKYPAFFKKVAYQYRGLWEWISCFLAACWAWSMAVITLLVLI